MDGQLVPPLSPLNALRWHSSGAPFWGKAGAKVLHFFELTKYFGIFFTSRCVFLSKTPNIPAQVGPEWVSILLSASIPVSPNP